MATLGDLLAGARRPGTIGRWLDGADPDLAGALRRAAAEEGEAPDAFVRIVIADFARAADEEAWARVMTCVSTAADPALACLGEMIRWHLSLGARASVVPPGGQ